MNTNLVMVICRREKVNADYNFNKRKLRTIYITTSTKVLE
jgi:hypothetical protein